MILQPFRRRKKPFSIFKAPIFSLALAKKGPLSDIWAVGCFVLQMLTGKPPWSKKSEFLGQIDYEEKTHEIPNEISKEAKDFLKCCFVKNPMFRFTVEMLLNHSFVRDLGDDDGGHHDEDNSINDDCSRSLSLDGESLLYEGIGLFPEFLGDESGTKDAGFVILRVKIGKLV